MVCQEPVEISPCLSWRQAAASCLLVGLGASWETVHEKAAFTSVSPTQAVSPQPQTLRARSFCTGRDQTAFPAVKDHSGAHGMTGGQSRHGGGHALVSDHPDAFMANGVGGMLNLCTEEWESF